MRGSRCFGTYSVPERLDLLCAVVLGRPLFHHRLVDDLNHLDEEGAGAGGRIEDLNESLRRWSALRCLQFLVVRCHFAPRGGIGEAVGEPELAAQQFVHRSHDVGDHRARGVEDASTNLQLLVVGGKEVLVEVDDRVFLGVAIAEVLDHCLHVGLVEQFHHFGGAQLVEVDARPAGLAAASAHAQKGFHQLRRNGFVRIWAASRRRYAARGR